MTIFEKELRKIFEGTTLLSDLRFIGNVCYGKLDEEVRVRMQIGEGRVAGDYDRLRITLLNRREGEIDSLILRFRDIWGRKSTSNPNFPEGIDPHIWTCGGKSGWYIYQPTKADYQKLTKAANDYLAVFQEMEPSRGMEQRMKGSFSS